MSFWVIVSPHTNRPFNEAPDALRGGLILPERERRKPMRRGMSFISQDAVNKRNWNIEVGNLSNSAENVFWDISSIFGAKAAINYSLSNNDRTIAMSGFGRGTIVSNVARKTKKRYVEFLFGVTSTTISAVDDVYISRDKTSSSMVSGPGAGIGVRGNGQVYQPNGSQFDSGPNLVVGDIIMFAVDFSTGLTWAGKNGTWFLSGNPSTGANPLAGALTSLTSDFWIMNSTDSAISSNRTLSANTGQYTYSIPSGFVSWGDAA